MAFQYVSCHTLTRAQLAPPLQLVDVEWFDAVNDNTTFSATVTVPDNEDVKTALSLAVEPDQAAIYVKSTSQNSWLWGGPIIDQEWDPATRTIKFTAQDWRSWLFNVFLGPKLNLSGDNTYTWTQVDQLQIAREIVGFALAGGATDGRPAILIGSETSGKLRDLGVKGLDFKYAGELLNTISSRAGGFEWYVEVTADAAGLPQPKLVLYYPQRGGLLPGLLLKSTPSGGNMRVNESVKRVTTDRRTRIWTTGSTETAQFAVDSDPSFATGFTLLREKQTSYSSVKDRTTLASHARAEREFLNPELNLLSVTVLEGAVPFDSYRAGDRARLIYQDDWYDIDLPAVRIVQRKLKPLSGAGEAELLLDLTDLELPEVDAGGAV
jgi:hypothetical protein